MNHDSEIRDQAVTKLDVSGENLVALTGIESATCQFGTVHDVSSRCNCVDSGREPSPETATRRNIRDQAVTKLSGKAAAAICHAFAYEPITLPSYVYIVEAVGLRRVKIGFSLARPDKRISSIQTSCPARLSLLRLIHGDRSIEGEIHAAFKTERQAGEWFRATPRLREFIDILLPIDVRHRKGAWIQLPVRGISERLDRLCRKMQHSIRTDLEFAGLASGEWRHVPPGPCVGCGLYPAPSMTDRFCAFCKDGKGIV